MGASVAERSIISQKKTGGITDEYSRMAE